MKDVLSDTETRMRRSLLRDLRSHKNRVSSIVPSRVDVVKKTWVIAKTTKSASMLEGRLERNVWSGDIGISFRRYTIKL
jgi:hypothetical protein